MDYKNMHDKNVLSEQYKDAEQLEYSKNVS